MEAWVMGGTSGIGAQIASRLQTRNIRTLTLSNDQEAGNGQRNKGGSFEYLDLDAEADQIVERTNSLLATYGIPTYVFMSAGLTRAQSVLETSVADWARIANVNLLGAIHFCNSVARAWQKSQAEPWTRQCIIIGSVNAFRPLSSQSAYSIMKAGLHAYAKCLSNDLAPDKVRVNVIAPGAIWTSMNADLFLDDRDGNAKKRVLDSALAGRWGKPEEIADVAMWLAIESPSFVSGAEFVIDGGHLVKR